MPFGLYKEKFRVAKSDNFFKETKATLQTAKEISDRYLCQYIRDSKKIRRC